MSIVQALHMRFLLSSRIIFGNRKYIEDASVHMLTLLEGGNSNNYILQESIISIH